MKQKIRINNNADIKMRVVLEPIVEEKILGPKETISIQVEFTKECEKTEDILEFNYSDNCITIYSSSAATADWC